MKKWIPSIVLALIVLWVVGDLVHSRLVFHWAKTWEAECRRDENGVLFGCDSYTVGEGEMAVLLVHGINASPRHYDKIAPYLAERGFTCRVMRLPGFAQPLDEYCQTTGLDWKVAVDRELQTLRAKHNSVGIVAHSLGGAVTISHLLDDPTAADFVVLLAPAVRVSDERSPVFSTRAWHEFSERAFLFTSVLHSPFGMDCHDPAHPDHPGRCPFTPIGVVEEMFTILDDNESRVGEFQTPMLMVVADADRVTDTAAARNFFALAKSQPKELLELTNSGHSIPLDYEWQRACDETIRFAERFNQTAVPKESSE